MAAVGVASYGMGHAHGSSAATQQLYTAVRPAVSGMTATQMGAPVYRQSAMTMGASVGQAPAMYGQEELTFAAPSSFAAEGPNTLAYSFLALGGLASAAAFFLFNKKSQSVAMAATGGEKEGFEMQRDGIKKAADDTVLTPRFYTTDFEECARLFSPEFNPDMNMKELEAIRDEFVKDYNQNHFVRNDNFKAASAWVQGDSRKIFIEFLERSCTAEFSGFLLYKELGRRLKDINPVVADIFTLMSRDEARHAGFLNKTMSDFDLALDLGFLTKHREYTFFKPKFIFYATYLSEKIGYWRYITIYRHLQRNPDKQFSPLFQYFENWCQDENRHGDFFSAVLKTQPQMLQGWDTKLWCRFFCHSVYITMYLNDHQRTAFYEQCGLNTTEFNQHVIRETNKTTARIFPTVPDVESPTYFIKMDKLVVLNNKLNSGELNEVAKAATVAQMAGIMLDLFWEKPLEVGSLDYAGSDAGSDAGSELSYV
uniref:magnesium-protoporphyrin IX monomethyl ester (oxidative) cyclase n=1 Tax=Eutreptiella gymnastica TaxID=73025 RepID=A0A7S1N8U9_9EUGL